MASTPGRRRHPFACRQVAVALNALVVSAPQADALLCLPVDALWCLVGRATLLAVDVFGGGDDPPQGDVPAQTAVHTQGRECAVCTLAPGSSNACLAAHRVRGFDAVTRSVALDASDSDSDSECATSN